MLYELGSAPPAIIMGQKHPTRHRRTEVTAAVLFLLDTIFFIRFFCGWFCSYYFCQFWVSSPISGGGGGGETCMQWQVPIESAHFYFFLDPPICQHPHLFNFPHDILFACTPLSFVHIPASPKNPQKKKREQKKKPRDLSVLPPHKKKSEKKCQTCQWSQTGPPDNHGSNF